MAGALTHFTVLVPLLLCLLSKTCCHTPNPAALASFFAELDTDGNGAIDAGEASSFIGDSIGGQEFDEQAEKADAAAAFLRLIDGGDAGSTVSVDELDVHLHSVLSGVRVWDWVRHGLGLPQYFDAFRNHSITPMDFPLLVQNDGRMLVEELGVASSFHRLKLVRAIRRQILGLGAPPSQPQEVSCEAGPRGTVAVRWSPPQDPGRPPLHRFVLERAGPAGQWQAVAELDDPHPAAALLDETAAAAAVAMAAAAAAATGGGGGGEAACVASARVLYRVAAWNLYGRSPYSTAGCDVELPPPGYPGAGGGGAVGQVAEPANGTNGARARGLPAGVEGPAPGAKDGVGGGSLPAEPLCAMSSGAAGVAAPSKGRSAPSGGSRAGQGWNSLLLLVLPWLLRLLPPSVLQGLAASLQRLLVRALQAARLAPPAWLLPRSHAVAGLAPAPALRPLAGFSAERAPSPYGTGTGRTVPGPAVPADFGGAAAAASVGALTLQKSAWEEGDVPLGDEASMLPAAAMPVPRRRGPLPAEPATAAGGGGAPNTPPVYGSPGADGGDRDGGEGSRHGGRGSGGRLPGLLARIPGMGPASASSANSGAASASAAGCGGGGGARSPPPSQAQPIPQPRRMGRGGEGGGASQFHRCSSEGDMVPGASHAVGAAPWADSSRLRGNGGGAAAGAAGAHRQYHHIGSAPALAGGSLTGQAPGSPAQRHLSYAGGGSGSGVSGAGGSGTRNSCPSTQHHQPHLQYHHAHASSADQLWWAGAGGGGGAGGGLGGEGMGVEAEAEMMLAAAAARLSGRDRDKVCAIPGCGRKLDLLHYRDYTRRHYCGRCQQTVCGAHTAYSPHGATGSCGHESRCVCMICFTHFNPAYQRFLKQRNTLKPAASTGTGTGSGGSTPNGALMPRPGSGAQLQALSRDSGEAPGGGKSASKLLWERAATKLTAVTRFRRKGATHAAAALSSSRVPPSMDTVVE